MDQKDVGNVNEKTTAGANSPTTLSPQATHDIGETQPKKTWWQRFKEPGSVWQILLGAGLGIAIGLPISVHVEEVPDAAIALLGAPGNLWLRALKAVVLPLIITAMILAVQRLRDISKGGAKMAKWTIIYYIGTTLIAVAHSCLLVGLVWSKLMVTASGDALNVKDSDKETIEEREDVAIHDVIVDMIFSFVPANVVAALAEDSLLAVLVTSIVVGCYIRGPDSSLLRAVKEIEVIITKIITVLIQLAPFGVFFLILSNIMRLDIAEIGLNLGILIGGTLANMFLHIVIILPAIFFVIVRKNPYAYWIKCSPAWITAWGTASSAATLPVTLKMVNARKVPVIVNKFVVPLGCLINMDGTAIYFPIVVVFLAATQGITLSPANYVVVCILSTIASIGTTPIPSSSLVLTVMIAGSVGVPITGMYAVVVAIDWFLDRFRTAMNVSGDMFAAQIIAKITGLKDTDGADIDDVDADPEHRGSIRV